MDGRKINERFYWKFINDIKKEKLNLNVLSLFDGISAGQLALKKSKIKVDNYFLSEIDKYAIKITQKNFPNTIQLGNILEWKNWKLPKIDLIIGGSPCQGFSTAGKGLNFEDPRSKLFFEFIDILKKYNPEYFLLENVKMKKEWQNIITNYMGVEPILINSSLVSAQSRKRLYWTNIPNVIQPEDKKIYLKDIIENGNVDRDKSYCIDANYYKGGSLKNYLEKSRRQIVNLPSTVFYQSEKRLMVKTIPHGYIKENIIARNKYPSLAAQNPDTKYVIQPENEVTWRKLTVVECERLQTFPDNYTEGVSNTQRYKALGNSWTVDVISHVFSFLPIDFISN